ncbi:probable serine racemase isoform X2 [Mizuhopecten yessoensis]|uniref:probable serine racemase isoform X2 n=1 Tax=Mizuhopecten yessoensis TaxID=6573 RepID=UPI000B45C76F|nr:probable serine racemase isoform X2 [Mizuhopecten yessoensis]
MAAPARVTLADIYRAHERILPYIHMTPVFTNSTFDKRIGRNAFFKAENLQKTGSFKARGALNAVSNLRDTYISARPVSTVIALKERNPDVPGVVTHSTGNHGQALAWAAKTVGLRCAVIVPHDTPQVKKDAISSYGAELVLCEPTPQSRQETCDKIAKEQGLEFIPPFDYNDVIAGQGTIAMELLKQAPDLDAILVPVSGGGMSSGIAIAAKAIKPGIKIYLVEAEGKMCEKSLRAGERLWPNPPQFVDTIADAIRTQQLGHVTWPILLNHAEKDVFSVNDEDMIKGMKFAFQRMKLVIEAASGAAVAAAMSDKLAGMDKEMKNIGVILCGGNVDIEKLPW